MYSLQTCIVLYLSLFVIRQICTHASKFKFLKEKELVQFFNIYFKEHHKNLMFSKNNWYRDTYNIFLILI